jgi:hypothetical protein
LGVGALPSEFGLSTVSMSPFAQDAERPVKNDADILDDSIRRASWKPQQPSAIGRRSVGDPNDMTTRPGQVVNRVGGVIGADGVGVGMSGRPGADVATQRAQRRRREYDVDEPWYVAEGVLPVLHPLPEPTSFDPGPGVIGIDRQ